MTCVPRGLVPLAVGLASLTGGCTGSPPVHPAPKAAQDITVAAVPGEGEAGLVIAQEQGLFAKADLRVTVDTVTSAAAAIPDLLRGGVQVVSGQYDLFIAADSSGIASIRVLAAGYSLAPHVQEVLVAPDAGASGPQRLRGATIAVNANNSEATDLLYTGLGPYGITSAQVHVVAIPFPAMPAALHAGRISAIYEIEPYVTEASQRYGDEQLLDIDSVAAQGLPISGYATLTSWATQHPQAAAAFARAVRQGNTLAATNLRVRDHALEAALHLSPNVAEVIAPGVFPAGLAPAQIQRVADMMLRYGQLPRRFDVTRILVGP